MRNLLIAVALLFSTFAFAEVETTISLKGLTLEKNQVVTVELRNDKHIYIQMFRVPTDIGSDDIMNVVLNDAVSGLYDVTVTVHENNAAKQNKGEYAVGKLSQVQITKVTIE